MSPCHSFSSPCVFYSLTHQCPVACGVISTWLVALLAFFLYLISGFIPVWLEYLLGVISVVLNLSRLGLCPNIWAVIENILCPLEKNVCSVILDKKLFKYWLCLSGLICRRSPLFPHRLSDWMTCPLLYVGYLGLWLQLCLCQFLPVLPSVIALMYFGASRLGA